MNRNKIRNLHVKSSIQPSNIFFFSSKKDIDSIYNRFSSLTDRPKSLFEEDEKIDDLYKKLNKNFFNSLQKSKVTFSVDTNNRNSRSENPKFSLSTQKDKKNPTRNLFRGNDDNEIKIIYRKEKKEEKKEEDKRLLEIKVSPINSVENDVERKDEENSTFNEKLQELKEIVGSVVPEKNNNFDQINKLKGTIERKEKEISKLKKENEQLKKQISQESKSNGINKSREELDKLYENIQKVIEKYKESQNIEEVKQISKDILSLFPADGKKSFCANK